MARFIPLQEIAKLPMLGNDDVLMRGKGRMLTWAKYVWEDMNLTTVKIVKREIIHINKRTNSITLPHDCLQFSSVNLIDRHGVIYPVFRNENVNEKFIEVSAVKDCACEFNCGHALCNTIKGYEAVSSVKTDKNPDGSDVSFTCVDRKAVDGQGFFYLETQYPKRIYTDGVWTSTVLYTEQKKMCKVEVDSNGCVCDTENNIDLLCQHCGYGNIDQKQICIGGTSMTPPKENCDTWIYFCNSKLDWFSTQCGHLPHHCNNVYNISDDNNRLIFPPNFGWDRVLVRYYADVNLKDMQIPFIAVQAFVAGLKFWDAQFNDKKQDLAVKYEQDYTRRKWGLLLEMNKYRIEELKMITTPPVYVPSYKDHRSDYNSGW